MLLNSHISAYTRCLAEKVCGLGGTRGDGPRMHCLNRPTGVMPRRVPCPRDVLEKGGHLPFQVLDASAIEGIRGLVGESSSIYICIQIYKALTPLPPQRIAA